MKRSPKNGKVIPRRASAAAQEKEDRALAEWAKGKSYQEVADLVGYSHRATAYRCIQDALTRRAVEIDKRAANGRAIAVARIMPIWIKAFELATGPDAGPREILAALQVADRLAKLEGVKDQAQEVRLTVESDLDKEIRDMMTAINNRADNDAARQ